MFFVKTLFSENLGFWVETEGLGPNLGSTVSLRIFYFFENGTSLKLHSGTLDFLYFLYLFVFFLIFFAMLCIFSILSALARLARLLCLASARSALS